MKLTVIASVSISPRGRERKAMNTTKTDYVPALGHDRLTPLYDVVMRHTMREKTFKIRSY